YRLPRAPLVQGHEVGAEVVKVGSAVGKFKPGDRVFIAPKVPCMQCYYCKEGHHPQCSQVKERLPGGFAEYVLVPGALVENGTYLLPDRVTFDQSTFIEPLACVVRAQRLAGLKKGQTALVLGCGMSGLLQIKLAKLKNAAVVATDVNPKRLELARNAGADLAIDASENVAQKLIDETGRKADVVFLCTSSTSAVEQAWETVDTGGAVILFAVPGPEKKVSIPLANFWTREIRILTSYYCCPSDLTEALDLIASGKIVVDDLITHTLPLEDIEKGFRLVMEGEDSIKVIIRPAELKQTRED
ncbi:MAG: zinc-binding dehydrogenase, partial [Bacillota bacterium]